MLRSRIGPASGGAGRNQAHDCPPRHAWRSRCPATPRSAQGRHRAIVNAVFVAEGEWPSCITLFRLHDWILGNDFEVPSADQVLEKLVDRNGRRGNVTPTLMKLNGRLQIVTVSHGAASALAGAI